MQLHASLMDLLIKSMLMGTKPGKFMVYGLKILDWRRILKTYKEDRELNKRKG